VTQETYDDEFSRAIEHNGWETCAAPKRGSEAKTTAYPAL